MLHGLRSQVLLEAQNQHTRIDVLNGTGLACLIAQAEDLFRGEMTSCWCLPVLLRKQLHDVSS